MANLGNTMDQHLHVGIRLAGDVFGVGLIIGTLVGYIPAAASGIAFVWYAIQIWESATCRNFVARLKSKLQR